MHPSSGRTRLPFRLTWYSMCESVTSKLHVLFAQSRGWGIEEPFMQVCESDPLVRERVQWLIVPPDAVSPQVLAPVEVMICGRLPIEWLSNASRLRWVQFLGAGVEASLFPEILATDIILTNASGVHATPIAEHVFGMMLMFARGLHRCVRQQLHNEWNRDGFRLQVRELHGATIGIIGLGSIGLAVAERAKAFGMRVLSVKRTASNKPTCVDELYSPQQLSHLLQESEYVVLCVPLTRETRGMLGENELRQMRRDAILINISRGAVVDQQALIRALQEGWIAGAGLDVFTPEPLPPDSPLWKMHNVIISPHVSGETPHYGARAAEIFLRNLHAYLRGDFASMVNVVDKTAGY